MPTDIHITTKDEVKLLVEVFGKDHKQVLIINPAIGVKRKLYHAFADYVAEQGITVVLYNYRGMEDGWTDLPGNVSKDAESWGRQDQAAVIKYAKTELQAKYLFVLGHSIGGQLLGFADNVDAVDGLIHVASQKGDYRLWPWWSKSGRLKLMLLWHVLIPWMSQDKFFNAKRLGLGTYPWPASAAKQWASWGRCKDYLFNPRFGFDLTPWHDFNKPLLSFGFTDDDLAPEAAIDGLLKEFSQNPCSSKKPCRDNGHIEKRIIDPHNLGLKSIGHFGFFKPEIKSIWQDVVKWIQNN